MQLPKLAQALPVEQSASDEHDLSCPQETAVSHTPYAWPPGTRSSQKQLSEQPLSSPAVLGGLQMGPRDATVCVTVATTVVVVVTVVLVVAVTEKVVVVVAVAETVVVAVAVLVDC